ncbi:MAG: zf-HC2 domain-containing protein [Candidatus Riflebacteria bacterium]|nr:zf-HC2 domain-containing protein [Candidatus Riflebacteria bacterium]
MDCQDWRSHLPALAAGDLSARRKQAMARHLAGCAGCRAELAKHPRAAARLKVATSGADPSSRNSDANGEGDDGEEGTPGWFDRLVAWLAETDLATRAVIVGGVAAAVIGVSLPLARLGPPVAMEERLSPSGWALESGRVMVWASRAPVPEGRRLPAFSRLEVAAATVVQRTDGLRGVVWPGSMLTFTDQGAELSGQATFDGGAGINPFTLAVAGGLIHLPVTGAGFAVLATGPFSLVELDRGTLSVTGSGETRSLTAGFSCLATLSRPPEVFPTVVPFLLPGQKAGEPTLERITSVMREALAPPPPDQVPESPQRPAPVPPPAPDPSATGHRPPGPAPSHNSAAPAGSDSAGFPPGDTSGSPSSAFPGAVAVGSLSGAADQAEGEILDPGGLAER